MARTLAERGIDSWHDLMDAWKSSDPETYHAWVAYIRSDEADHDLTSEASKRHFENLAAFRRIQPDLYLAMLKMQEDHSRPFWESLKPISPSPSDDGPSEKESLSTMREPAPIARVETKRATTTSAECVPPNRWDGYPEDWDERARDVRRRDGLKCRNCDRTDLPLHVHHIVPKARGGSHRKSNLATLCEYCHIAVHPHMAEPTYGYGRVSYERAGPTINWGAIALAVLMVVLVVWVVAVVVSTD